MTMSASDNKSQVRLLYDHGWQNGDLATIDRVFAPEHVLHWNDREPVDQHRTTGEVKQIVKEFRQEVPDLKVTIDQLVAEGDRVVVQVTFEGTHTGQYETYAPTHKRIRFTDMQILRFSGEKIVESSLPAGGLQYFLSMLEGTV
jgi:predicted ester cyclase